MTVKPQVLLLSLILAGCAVGPDYQRPDISLETRFLGGSAESVGAVAAETWWNNYNDALLGQLIKRGAGAEP